MSRLDADLNGDGDTNIADAISVFRFLFLGGAPPTCRESADLDNDGRTAITDGIVLLRYLFLDSPGPAAPGPASSPCGEDPDPPGSKGDLGCDAYDGC